MDNLTHGLLGAVIGMARPRDGGAERDRPLSATDRAVPWATFIAGELPDLDTFWKTGNPLDELIYHRGITHAVIVAPLVALVAATAVKLVWREARFRTLLVWSLLSVLVAHLLNDWMTAWGTRLLLPWSEARLALDWVPIIDLLYTLPLIAAAWVAARKPRLRRKATAAVLAYLTLYTFGYRGLSHWAVERTVTRHYASARPVQLNVTPNLFNPLVWNWTVDLGDRFEQGHAYLWSNVQVTEVTRRPVEDEVIRAVRAAPELKPLFDQFAYTQVEYVPTADGYRVSLGDVRYRFAGRNMGYTALLSMERKVLSVASDGW